jgi:hypothetical protein
MFRDEGGERGEDLEVPFQDSIEGCVCGVFVVVHSIASKSSSASSESSVGEFVHEVGCGFGCFVEDVVLEVGIHFFHSFIEFGEDSFIEVIGEGVSRKLYDFGVTNFSMFF